MANGAPPNVTHTLGGERMTHNLYLKQTNSGSVIGGGDLVVIDVNDTLSNIPNLTSPFKPVDLEKINSNKGFATKVVPML